jgi:lipopolysaccharide transport system permease protein
MNNVVIIKPSKGWSLIDTKEVWRYRDLLYFLAVRGIKAKYAQSVLGIGWAIVQPVVTMLVFTVIFGRVAKVSSDDIPYALFAFLGLWPWSYFAGTLTESANSLISNASMITKVYFPRMILPLASVLSRLLDFTIAFLIVVALLIYYQITPSIGVFWLPVLIIQLLLTSLGLGMILSALSVQYRDVKYALTFMVQLLMYSAPVVYSTTAISEEYQFLYSLNPMVGVIEGIRAVFLNRPMPWEWIIPGSGVALILFPFGMLFFRKMEKKFADVA